MVDQINYYKTYYFIVSQIKLNMQCITLKRLLIIIINFSIKKTKKRLKYFKAFYVGTLKGNRTPDSAVRGQRPNR